MNDHVFIRSRVWLAVAVVAFAVQPVSAAAWADKHDQHPGYVDGSGIVELAGDEGKLIEVSLHGAVLKQVARAFSKNESSLGSFLKGMVSISAVVIEQPTDVEKARTRIREMAAQLEEDHWERLGRIREEGQEIWVYVLGDEEDEELDGLTVIVNKTNGGELIFVNLAGRVDLEQLGGLGVLGGIPDLEQLGSKDWQKELKQRRRKRSAGRSLDPGKEQDREGDE